MIMLVFRPRSKAQFVASTSLVWKTKLNKTAIAQSSLAHLVITAA